MGILQTLYEIGNKVAESEARLWEQNYRTAKIVLSEVSKNWVHDRQQPALFGTHKALVVDTIDPLQQNRVRFYSPLLDSPKIPRKQLPFARPISPFGGFDDCGVTWVPPAGSTLIVMFEGGQRSAPYYLGTTWSRDRGEPPHDFGVAIQEYDDFHSGERDGYIEGVGKDNEEIFPPWNTENYNIKDIDNEQEFNEDPEAQRKVKIPHIYGFKTPQKHRLKMVDGNYECNFRWKRIELASGNGNWMMFKDDHLHTCGQWAHPDCNCETSGMGLDDCTDEDGNPIEKTECEGDVSNSTIQGGHPDHQELAPSQEACGNENFKRKEECRPYKGPGTPENNRCSLYQTGWQIASISGHTMWADDSVAEPREKPKWQKYLDSFDFGCNDKFLGKMCIKSATGHLIELNDIEDEPRKKRRGEKNGIKLKTATGNRLELLDHTIEDLAGPERGIWMESTSKHHLYMVDEENEQKSPDRKSGGEPDNKSKKAYVELKSGYGLELLMRDDNSQQDTQSQFIRLKAPQKDNTQRGPHILWMQETPSGPGTVLLECGGYFVGFSYDEWVEMVGVPEDVAGMEPNPASKMEIISDAKLELIENEYINLNKETLIIADDKITLLAGKDCPNPDDLTACAGPVVVFNPSTGRLGLSDRIIGSISPDSQDVNIGMINFGFDNDD